MGESNRRRPEVATYCGTLRGLSCGWRWRLKVSERGRERELVRERARALGVEGTIRVPNRALVCARERGCVRERGSE